MSFRVLESVAVLTCFGLAGKYVHDFQNTKSQLTWLRIPMPLDVVYVLFGSKLLLCLISSIQGTSHAVWVAGAPYGTSPIWGPETPHLSHWVFTCFLSIFIFIHLNDLNKPWEP